MQLDLRAKQDDWELAMAGEACNREQVLRVQVTGVESGVDDEFCLISSGLFPVGQEL